MKKIFLTSLLFMLSVPSQAYALTEIRTTGAYFKTVQTWTRAYNDLLTESVEHLGTSYITPLSGNGKIDPLHRHKSRDTIIFIPESTTIERPVDFIFYFHGLGGFKYRDFRMRTLRHTRYLNYEANYVLVIAEMPWSRHTFTPRARQGRVFTRKGEFGKFTQSVKSIVNAHYKEVININKAILVGHSAGGSTLMSISRSGGIEWLLNNTATKEIKIIFSDASYGKWLDITWKYLKSYMSQIKIVLLTRKWDRPYKNAQRFLNRFKNSIRCVKHIVFNRRLWRHGAIGDEAMHWVYEPEDVSLCVPYEHSGCGEGEKNDRANE